MQMSTDVRMLVLEAIALEETKGKVGDKVVVEGLVAMRKDKAEDTGRAEVCQK